MDQRNILWGRHDLEMELDGPGYNIHPEPCIVLGGMSSGHQPNIHPGNRTRSIDPHHLPEHYDGSMPYAMAQYNVVQHQAPSIDVSPRMSLVPINYGPGSSQVLSHGNFVVHGGSFHEYGRSHFVDGVGGPYKRKNIENLHESCHFSDASTSTASSSFAAAPVEAAYVLPQFVEDDVPAPVDETSSRSVRVREGSSGINSVPPHNFNHPNRVNYTMGQFFNRAAPFWFDQPSSSNSADGGALPWNQAPALPYVHAGNVNGVPLEVGNLGLQEADSNRNSPPFPHFPYINPQHYNAHYPSPPVHGIRGGNFPFPPQIPAAFHRIPAHGAPHSGPFEPNNFRMPWHQNGGTLPDTMPRRRSGPQLRVLPVDEVAIIDLDDGYGGEGSYDHHRDMRLDIEEMSYEDLLALGELIGSVNTGLSEETVTCQLKTRTWLSLASINLEELPCEDQEAASCIICQDVYENRDRIGVLDCGHEYHASCLKKWLVLKNTCPICKSEALPQRK